MQLFLAEYSPGADMATLDKDEARHAMKVLRHSVGDALHCVDGHGHKLTTTIASGNDKAVQLTVHDVEHNWGEPKQARGLLFAPPKARDRLEWLLQKATELGVTHLFPVQTARTERKRLNTERATAILASAMKQSLRSRLPLLTDYQRLDDAFIESEVLESFAARLVAHCHAQRPKNLNIKQLQSESVVFAIGPEGDFDASEVELLSRRDFEAISLGKNRLRTETAAIYVLSAHHFAQL